MTDNDSDSVTVVTGYFTLGADEDDVDAIRNALQECGYAVDIDQSDGSITVQHAPNRSERSDTAADDTQQNLTKREQRIQRLENEIEEGEAYTSDELCAIAYDIDAAEVSTSQRAYLSNLRANGHIDLQSMPDPNRGRSAKLYYRGEQPDVAVSDEQEDPAQGEEEQERDTADCQYCGEEYTKRGVRRHERCCDENPDVETAWTGKRVESVMQDSGWMTTEEIAQSVLDKEDVSHDDRDRFHDLVSRKPDLAAQVTSRPDPADQRRNQYRFIDDTGTADSDDGPESESACGCPTNAAGEVQHEGDCPHGVEQEIEEMQEDLYQEDDATDPDRPDPDPEPDPAAGGTEEDDDEDADDEDSEDAFTCKACGQQFDTFHGLRDHHCDTGDFPCLECDTAFDDDAALQNHLRDKHPGFYGDDPVTAAGTDADDEDELLDEMGPCNLGKIMIQGEFERYVCQECDRTFHEESAADVHADDASHPTFKAFEQVPDREKQPAGYVGGSTAR